MSSSVKKEKELEELEVCKTCYDKSYKKGLRDGREGLIKDEIKWLEDFKRLLIMENPKLENRIEDLKKKLEGFKKKEGEKNGKES